MTPKNDFPVQYDRNMTDADLCRDLYARNFMYSALIQMLAERLELADEGRGEGAEEAESAADGARQEVDDLNKEMELRDRRVLELERENDGMQTTIDDLRTRVFELEQETLGYATAYSNHLERTK